MDLNIDVNEVNDEIDRMTLILNKKVRIFSKGLNESSL